MSWWYIKSSRLDAMASRWFYLLQLCHAHTNEMFTFSMLYEWLMKRIFFPHFVSSLLVLRTLSAFVQNHSHHLLKQTITTITRKRNENHKLNMYEYKRNECLSLQSHFHLISSTFHFEYFSSLLFLYAVAHFFFIIINSRKFFPFFCRDPGESRIWNLFVFSSVFSSFCRVQRIHCENEILWKIRQMLTNYSRKNPSEFKQEKLEKEKQ